MSRSDVGRFERLRLLGRGGMGEVWQARDARTGGVVALKLARDGADQARFEREAGALASLDHPGIVRHIEHGLEGGRAYLAMEWLDGEDLAARLSRGRLSVPEALSVVWAAADALAHAHERGLVHRDIKPSNLFLVGKSLAAVKVIDFGIVRDAGATARDSWANSGDRGVIIGTLGYMSPEQLVAAPDVDARSDVFSLGCVLFECLAGRAPFVAHRPMALLAKILADEAPPLSSFVPGVPRGVDALAAAMLSNAREARPAGGGAVRDLVGLARAGDLRAMPRRVLGSRERRVVTVIVFPAEVAATGATTDPSRQPTETVASTRQGEAGSLTERTPDGAGVVVLAHLGTPRDHAVAACRYVFARLGRTIDRAAIATGHAVGDDDAAVGPIVERARGILARLEAGQVGVDDASGALAGARFDVELVEFGGLVRRAIEPARRGGAGGVVGRERELSALRDALDGALGGQLCAALVVGDAGLGKSTLLDELRARVEALGEPATFVAASAAALESLTPYALLRSLLRSARSSRLAPLLGGHPGLLAIEENRAPQHDEVAAELAAWLGEAAAAGPVALALDDLHWADAPSVRAVALAASACAGRPLLLALAGRPSVDQRFGDALAGLGAVEVRLGGLEQGAAEALVERLASGALSRGEQVNVVERGQGNPYLLEELVRASTAAPGWAMVSLLGVVQSGIALLSQAARRALRAASVIGQRFSLADVAAVLGDGAEPADVAEALGEATRASLIRAGDPGGHAFRHALTHEAAYAMIPEAELRDAHARAAGYLESRPEAGPALLAHHHARAGNASAAVPLFVKAATDATAAGDRAAVVAFEAEVAALAPEHPGRVDLLHMLSRYGLGGPPEERYRTAKLALSMCPAGDERRASLLSLIAETDPRAEVFEATVAELEKLELSEASLNSLLSLWSAVQGSGLRRPPSLDRAIERHLARFPHRRNTTRYWFLLGENELAVESTDATFASGAGRGAFEERFLYFLRSYFLVHLGRPHEALAEAEKGAALVRYPLSHSTADLLLCRGDVADALSDHAAALEHFLAGQQVLSRLSGYSSRETIRHTIRACDQLVHLRRFGEVLEQLAPIEHALDVFGAMAPLAGAVRAASLAALGAREEARTAARQALSQLNPEWSFDGGPYRPRSVLARALLDVGERQEALEQARLALDEVAAHARKIRTAQRRRDFLDRALGVPAALALGAELGLPLPTEDS